MIFSKHQQLCEVLARHEVRCLLTENTHLVDVDTLSSLCDVEAHGLSEGTEQSVEVRQGVSLVLDGELRVFVASHGPLFSQVTSCMPD